MIIGFWPQQHEIIVGGESLRWWAQREKSAHTPPSVDWNYNTFSQIYEPLSLPFRPWGILFLCNECQKKLLGIMKVTFFFLSFFLSILAGFFTQLWDDVIACLQLVQLFSWKRARNYYRCVRHDMKEGERGRDMKSLRLNGRIERSTLGSFRLVTLHVQSQMIGSSKASLAHLAAERFGPRVLPVVAGKLVRTSKTPLTLWPVAAVRFLTCVKESRRERERERENKQKKNT